MYANLSLLSQKLFFIYTAKGYHDSEGCTHYESVFVELRYFGKHLATELPVIVSKLAIWLVVKKEKFQASYCFGTLCFQLDVCNMLYQMFRIVSIPRSERGSNHSNAAFESSSFEEYYFWMHFHDKTTHCIEGYP